MKRVNPSLSKSSLKIYQFENEKSLMGKTCLNFYYMNRSMLLVSRSLAISIYCINIMVIIFCDTTEQALKG